MDRRRLAIPMLLFGAACAPALQPLPPIAPLPEPPAESPPPGDALLAPAPVRDAAFEPLRERGLMVPVAGVAPWQVPDTYDAPRDGVRRHDALDIHAPRGTPVLAADDGVILRVGTNALGGNVIWAADYAHRFAYYYAHLDRFANGLRDGQSVMRGDVIGYVGTTGNAPLGTPHLHFQVMRIVEAQRYSSGPPFNPRTFFTVTGTATSPAR